MPCRPVGARWKRFEGPTFQTKRWYPHMSLWPGDRPIPPLPSASAVPGPHAMILHALSKNVSDRGAVALAPLGKRYVRIEFRRRGPGLVDGMLQEQPSLFVRHGGAGQEGHEHPGRPLLHRLTEPMFH